MLRKLILILILLSFFKKFNFCKLFCVVCREELPFTKSKFYCCMEDWESKPRVRKCETQNTRPSTVVPITPCGGSRCPESKQESEEKCDLFKRINPNPKNCFQDSDCREPFNICCFDYCYAHAICKTYFESQI